MNYSSTHLKLNFQNFFFFEEIKFTHNVNTINVKFHRLILHVTCNNCNLTFLNKRIYSKNIDLFLLISFQLFIYLLKLLHMLCKIYEYTKFINQNINSAIRHLYHHKEIIHRFKKTETYNLQIREFFQVSADVKTRN